MAKGRARAEHETDPSRILLEVWLEQLPKAENRVQLDDAPDRLGIRAAGALAGAPEEVQTSRQLTRSFMDEVERLALGRVEPLAARNDDEAWRDSIRDAAHPVGTTRMAFDAREE